MARLLGLSMLLLALLDVAAARAQSPDAHTPSQAARAAEQLRHQRTAMTILTAWGTASMGTGATMMAFERDRDFWLWGGLQHLLWGATNVVIGASSLYRTNHTHVHEAQPDGHWRKRAARMRRVFWINAALDVLYVGSAALLWGLSKRRAAQGSGAAIAAQGGFLLGFDIAAALSVP